MYYGWSAFSSKCKNRRWVRWKHKQLFNSQLCQKYCCQKLLKSTNLSSSYDRQCRGCFLRFLLISMHILLDLLSLDSAEAYIEWSGKLNSHLMASCARNIFTKNYQNLTVGFQVTIENVEDVFLGHSVEYDYNICNKQTDRQKYWQTDGRMSINRQAHLNCGWLIANIKCCSSSINI